MSGMEPADEATLRFYGENAAAYAEREMTSRQVRLGRFLALLSPGAAILELGCGAGSDTAEMLARDFDISPTDGSPEMAEVASRRSVARSGRYCSTTSTRLRPMTAFGPMPACCTSRGPSLRRCWR